MTREELISLISSKVEGQGNQVDVGNALPKVLYGILDLLGIKRVELLYDSRTDKITYLGEQTELGYDDIAPLVDDKSNFVTLFTIEGEYLLPQVNDGGAVIFTGLNVLSYGSWAHRVAINVDNEIKAEYYELEMAEKIGNLADLDTEHKSDIVSAINEVADLVETSHHVISFQRSSSELKAIYDECARNLIIAKNIVFFNMNTNLYYVVNGYNMVNGILKLHVFIGSTDTIINLSPNGTLSIG